jgi:Fe-S-cluster containining protein
MTIQELYALLPGIKCKGLCSECCGPIGMHAAEWEHMGKPDMPHQVERNGRIMLPMAFTMDHLHAMMELGTGPDCPLLVNRRCSVYDRRPLICRIWGLTRDMACPHGCVPDRWMSEAESRMLLRLAASLKPVEGNAK